MTNNQTQYKLDEWDCKFINLFKSMDGDNPVTLDMIKAIWADRCALDIKYVHLRPINSHLLDVAYKIGLFNNGVYAFNELVMRLNKENNYYFTCTSRKYFNQETTDFDLILLSRLDSLFSMANVVDLPGYREYLNKLKT